MEARADRGDRGRVLVGDREAGPDRDRSIDEQSDRGVLAEGDQVIRYPTALLKDNQPVQAAGATKAAMASSPAAN